MVESFHFNTLETLSLTTSTAKVFRYILYTIFKIPSDLFRSNNADILDIFALSSEFSLEVRLLYYLRYSFGQLHKPNLL